MMESLTVLTWRIPHCRSDTIEHLISAGCDKPAFMHEMARRLEARELVLLTTCQRVLAAYPTYRDPDIDAVEIADALSSSVTTLPHPEVFTGWDAFQHLCDLITSLDSIMPGEPQVSRQVKQAYQRSREMGLTGRFMRTVFPFLFRVVRKVRRGTGLIDERVSLITLLVPEISAWLSTREHAAAAVVGTGVTGRSTVGYLSGVELHVVSRDAGRARRLAERVGGVPYTLDEFLSEPPPLDLLVLALRTDAPYLTPGCVRGALDPADRPLLVVDLGMPRNSSVKVGSIRGCTLIQMDDMLPYSLRARQERRAEIRDARRIIAGEVSRIRRWWAGLQRPTGEAQSGAGQATRGAVAHSVMGPADRQ